MKKMIRFLIVAALVVACLVPTVFAAGTTVDVTDKTAAPNDTVTVDVTISGNPGFKAFNMNLEYDKDALELTSITFGEMCNGFTSSNLENGTVVFATSNNITANGVLFTATFVVKAESGAYDVKVNVTNLGANNVDIDLGTEPVVGTITVDPCCHGHSFTNYVSDGNATCTEDGTKTAKCDRCDVTNTIADEGSAKGHSFTNYVSNNDATCTEDGTKTAKCDRCDAKDTVADEGSAKGHSFTNYVSNNDATCTEDGSKTAKCDHCDAKDTVTDEGSAKGHSWKAATCVDGKICSVCGATEGKELGHSYGDWTQAKAPTCTEKGEETHKCSACGKTETREVAALGHKLTKVAGVAATTEKEGIKEHWVCEHCGKLYADAEGTVETTLEALTIAKLVLDENPPTGDATPLMLLFVLFAAPPVCALTMKRKKF